MVWRCRISNKLRNAYFEYEGPKVVKYKMRCLGHRGISRDLVGKAVFK